MKENKSGDKVKELAALEQINLHAAGVDIGAAEIHAAVPPGRDD